MAKKKRDHGELPAMIDRLKSFGIVASFGYGSTWEKPYVIMIDYREVYSGSLHGAIDYVASMGIDPEDEEGLHG